MVWVNIIKALGIASFDCIYPKIFTSSKIRGVGLINKSYFSFINKTTVASFMEVSKKARLFIIFTPQTSPIVILIIIPPVSEFIVSLTVILHTTYLTRQEVDQTFDTTCKSLIDFVNLLINKRLKCLSFCNIFANLATIFVTFPLPNQSLSHWINFSSYQVTPKSSKTAKLSKGGRVKYLFNFFILIWKTKIFMHNLP